ncbi:AT hook motif-containing protein [Cyclospora cayetanensis]|uniref:AT hook motif-containing protein n=1 Tax=Cyclospora cayetanensis TaxID=88456 RepID=A0A1D3CUY7_9EIME|nr:AT hook motif-containing protein [Cyclospora cayetanensis]
MGIPSKASNGSEEEASAPGAPVLRLVSQPSFNVALPARLHLGSGSGGSGGSNTVSVQHEGFYEEIDSAENGNLRWGRKKANDGSWVEKWAVQTVPQQEPQARVLEFGQSQGRNYRTNERWVSRWEDTARERRVEKVVQELRPQHKDEEQEGEQEREQAILQVWEEEETEDRLTGQELELFEETRGSETRGRLQRREADGRVLYQALWRETAGGQEAWSEETTFHSDGSKTGTKKGTDPSGTSWEEEWQEQPDATRDSVRRRRTENSRMEERRGVRRSHPDNQLEEYCTTVQVTVKEGCAVECTDTWVRPAEGGPGKARGSQRKETQIFSDGKVVSVEVANEEWEDTGDEFSADLWVEETLVKHQGGATHRSKRQEHDTRQLDLSVGNLWGRKKGSRRKDGMQWGEQWEETQEIPETETEEPEAGQQRVNLHILLPGGEVTSREVVVLQTQPLRRRRRFDDKWWREAHGNSWGTKEGVEDSGAVLRENWYDNGGEKQVDRWKEMPDGSKKGEKFGSKVDGTQWRESWGCGPGGSDSWVDKSWEEPDREREGGAKFIEKVERHANGDEQTLKEGNEWIRSDQCDRAVTSWFEERFGVVDGLEEKWAVKRGGNEEGEWMERWRETPQEKDAEKTGWNRQGDAWEERWRETFDGDQKTETWAEKKGSNAQGESWLETWQERWGWKTAHKEATSASGARRVERWGEQFFDDGSGQKWAQHWQEGPPSSPGGSSPGSTGKSWGDRWGPGGLGGHRWGEEWGDGGCRKWAHDTPGRPEGC